MPPKTKPADQAQATTAPLPADPAQAIPAPSPYDQAQAVTAPPPADPAQAATAPPPHLAPGAPADQDARAAYPVADHVPDPAAPEGVTLHIAHPIKHDGTLFGPGDVTVTAELAEIFRALGIVTE